jgi:peptide/nickel transport system substrate-binding protein
MGADVIKIERPDGGDDACKKIGMKIDMQIMNWSTLLQRANNRQGVDKGRWHTVSTFTVGVRLLNPASCT